MTINLPKPPDKYDTNDQQAIRAAIAQADRANQKRNSRIDMGRAPFTIQSPNGTIWNVQVADDGTLSTSGYSGGGGGAAPVPALTHNHVFVGNAAGNAGDVALSGDGVINDSGALTISKSGGVPFGTAAFDAASAFDAAGAAAAAQAAAEAYDDAKYTSGTFTPTLTIATPGDGVITYTTQAGSFYQIGKLVFFEIRVTAKIVFTTAAGAITMFGLPMAAADANWLAVCGGSQNGIVWPTGSSQIIAVPVGTSPLGLGISFQGTNFASVSFGIAHITSNTVFRLKASGVFQAP